MRPANVRLLALALLVALMMTACGGRSTDAPSMAVGAGPDPESALLANVYAAALRSYGTPAHVETLPDPLVGLDTGQVSVVPGFTGQLLQRFAPGSSETSDELVYKAMVGTLPEGVSAGDYTTAAEDKPAVALTESTAVAWGGRDLTVLVSHCQALNLGARKGGHPPAKVGTCTLPAAHVFPDDAALFNALRAGQINAAVATTADPDVPADVLVLTDAKTPLIQAENVVPLYRRNGLTAREVLAINQVAGVLDTAALKQMRQQVANGTDPRAAAEIWLADNPLGR